MVLENRLIKSSQIQNMTLLCERSVPGLFCEEIYLGSTILIGENKFKIDCLKFNNGKQRYTTEQILTEILTNEYLCGIIPQNEFLDKDLIEYKSSIDRDYLLAIKKV